MSFASKARKARDKGKIVVIYDGDVYYASAKNVVVYDNEEKASVKSGKAFDRLLAEYDDAGDSGLSEG